MGYMATLRNLRNILKENVSKNHIEKVCDYISNPIAVRNSKQLPFRFLSAYRMLVPNIDRFDRFDNISMNTIKSPYLSMILEALEKAISESIFNIPMFDNENVLIATDVSASMQYPISHNSVITTYDIGTVLAMMMYKKCKYSITGMFGNIWKVVDFPKTEILRNANDIYKREGEVGYSTNGWKVLDWANKNKNTDFDSIMIFTDCQLWNNEYDNDNELPNQWNLYKKTHPYTKLYIFDLSGYGNTPLNIKDNDVYLISGWSDKIFDVLSSIINGGDTLDNINRIEL
jgi:hypothetical protein